MLILFPYSARLYYDSKLTRYKVNGSDKNYWLGLGLERTNALMPERLERVFHQTDAFLLVCH